MKTCPFCAEEIQDAAIKCKHCGEFLEGPNRSMPPGPKLPWCFRTYVIVIATGCVGPFSLPLVWWHPKLTVRWKIFWTLIILALTYLLGLLFMHSLEVLEQYYELMEDF